MLNDKSGTERELSRSRLLLALLPVLLIAAVLTPTSAFAQGGSSCDADVSNTRGEAVADFTEDCGSDTLVSVDITSNEDGSIEAGEGTDCTGAGRTFTCAPTSASGSRVSGRFIPDDGTFCGGDPTMLTFTPETDTGVQAAQELEAPCEGSSGTGDDGSGDGSLDDESVPEGGVDSGAGGTVQVAGARGASLSVAGTALISVSLLAAGLLLHRRTRTSR